MTSKPANRSWRRETIAICLGLHLLADLLLFQRVWFLEPWPALIVIGLPLSQCSLAALWAATNPRYPLLRFAVPPLATIVCWHVLTRILPWGVGEPASAAWAFTLGGQVFVIILAIHLYQRISHRDSRNFTFDLLTLMLWMTVFAVAFGFAQFGRANWGWSSDIVRWEFFYIMPIVAIFNALLAVLWFWALTTAGRPRRIRRSVLVLVSIGPLAYALSIVANWVSIAAMSVSEAIVFAGGQSVILALSIAIVVPWNHTDQRNSPLRPLERPTLPEGE